MKISFSDNFLANKFVSSILAVLGLFVSVPYLELDKEKNSRLMGWRTTLSVGGVPFGWIIILLAWFVQLF